MEFPKTLQEFQAAFPDGEACWEAVRRARWPEGFICPRCGHDESSWISTRRLEQCRRCRYQCSVTAGTVFHRTRVPLLTWFWAIFFLARHKKGISALQLQRDTGLGSYETAWTMLHKLRSTLGPRPRERLTGLVEVDETYVGARERGLRGGRQLVGKTLVAGAVEHRPHHAGRARLAVIQGLTFERTTSAPSFGASSTPLEPRSERMDSRATGASPTSVSGTIDASRGPTPPARWRSCPGSTGSSATSRPGSAAPSTG